MEDSSQLQKLLDSMVIVLSDIIESRDRGMNGHIERTTKYLKTIIDAMIERKIYFNELNELNKEILYSSARLYDIGKIFIPEMILNKPDKLSFDEFQIMKTHAIKGEQIIDRMTSLSYGEASGNDGNILFLKYAKLFAGYHHERWDGKGYPRGLDRLNIPIHGRIMALIDVYDALTSRRPYKEPFSPEEAAKIIMDSAGEMFDPLITEVFFDVKKQLKGV